MLVHSHQELVVLVVQDWECSTELGQHLLIVLVPLRHLILLLLELLLLHIVAGEVH